MEEDKSDPTLKYDEDKETDTQDQSEGKDVKLAPTDSDKDVKLAPTDSGKDDAPKKDKAPKKDDTPNKNYKIILLLLVLILIVLQIVIFNQNLLKSLKTQDFIGNETEISYSTLENVLNTSEKYKNMSNFEDLNITSVPIKLNDTKIVNISLPYVNTTGLNSTEIGNLTVFKNLAQNITQNITQNVTKIIENTTDTLSKYKNDFEDIKSELANATMLNVNGTFEYSDYMYSLAINEIMNSIQDSLQIDFLPKIRIWIENYSKYIDQ